MNCPISKLQVKTPSSVLMSCKTLCTTLEKIQWAREHPALGIIAVQEIVALWPEFKLALVLEDFRNLAALVEREVRKG